jgi:tyrosine-protein kinase Etk/Wzc
MLGVIPHLDNFDNFDSFLNEDIKYNQAIETSILNIESLFPVSQNIKENDSCRKIVISGPTPENGKSFISRSIALGLSEIGHKVLLLDADLKRGRQHKFFDKETIDMKSFLNISLDQIDNLKIRNNFYLLPSIKKLKNSFEHLYSQQFLRKISDFESFFDYIIFDTAPILSVSDTGLLMTSSDLNILTVRHEVNKINEINQSKQIIEQLGRSFDGIIYNDYSKPKSYYGYYDLYGDYSYRYYAERYLYDDYYETEDD